MNHDSIFKAYPNARSICDVEGSDPLVYDANGNLITIDASVVAQQDSVVATEAALRDLRHQRNILLAETDWWCLSDQTATQAQLDYRQALRDITDSYSSIDSVVWPDKP